MAARDVPAVTDPQPHQHIAAECLGKSHALARTRWRDRAARLAHRQPVQHLVDHRQALLDLLDADPGARVDIAFVPHRYLELQLAIGRVADRTARVEIAARGATDM